MFFKKRATDQVPVVVGEALLDALFRCGGYYKCPHDIDIEPGRRVGPLVGYTGRYDAPDGSRQQYVGEIYANFAYMEEFPHILELFAQQLTERFQVLRDEAEVFCGAPLGGLALAQSLARLCRGRYVYPEKQVVAVASPGGREISELVFGRHEIHPGDRVVLVEDVTNNFDTTVKMIKLIQAAGGTVVAITCLLNRSTKFGDVFRWEGGEVPILPLLRKPIDEWRQDDPAVADDIARGNVVWKPKAKENWSRLVAAMKDPHENSC